MGEKLFGGYMMNKISSENQNFIDEKIYKKLRKRWSDYLTANEIEDKNNQDYRVSMRKLEEEAQSLLARMNLYDLEQGDVDTRTELWTEFHSDKVSAHLTNTLTYLHTMVRAYASEGCSLYKNKNLGKVLLAALDWFYANRYNENVKMYNNWWDWTIGGPQRLNDILVLMYEDLSEEQLTSHLRALKRFVPTPVEVPRGPNPLTGANLLDTALVCAISGLLEESNTRLSEAKEAVSAVLPYVTKGDGFYTDGSFIQHTDIPYAGGYGSVLMSSLSELLFITEGTPWEIVDPLLNHVFEWIINAFEPVCYKGAMMDMVSGRGITRYHSSDHHRGKELLIKILQLAQIAKEPMKTRIKAFVKENIQIDSMQENDYFEQMNVHDVLAFKEILSDETLAARGDLQLHKVYGAMDRVVHHRPGFLVGISMYSERIAPYEVGNGENKKGWHTSDGMLYLYNGDLNQYRDAFWPTVDMLRLPGITTDHSIRTNKDWACDRSSQDWVGGSSIYDLYGATGMAFEMEPGRSTLIGKKSWFMFDDEIVALGAGITASDNRLVETIVENRKIKISGDNLFVVDDEKVLDGFGEVKREKVSWAFLGGNTPEGTDTIGYYFPDQANIKVIREVREGDWQMINENGTDTQIKRNYLSVAIEHGNNPTNEKYSYVLLPNKTMEEVVKYSGSPDITILANTEEIQAVRENKFGIVGMNFWNPTSCEYVTAKNPCSVMLHEKDDQLWLGIADPTHKAKDVKIVLDKSNYNVISKEETISIKDLGNQIEVTIHTENSMGKTHKVALAFNSISKTSD